MSKELAKKESSIVAQQLQAQEVSLGAEVAMKALKLVEPMIESVSKELTDTLGDNETIIVIKVTKRGAPATITMLDTSEDFTICGKKANKRTANAAKDAFIKRMLDDGTLSKEEHARMMICDNEFLFTGEAGPDGKPKARRRFYVIRDFVDALLTGRMENITKQLMK